MVSYEEQVTQLREQLADVYAQEEDFTRAAQLLSGIDLDSGQHQPWSPRSLRDTRQLAVDSPSTVRVLGYLFLLDQQKQPNKMSP